MFIVSYSYSIHENGQKDILHVQNLLCTVHIVYQFVSNLCNFTFPNDCLHN